MSTLSFQRRRGEMYIDSWELKLKWLNWRLYDM